MSVLEERRGPRGGEIPREELVRAVFQAFARRDGDALCALCSDDVVFEAQTGRLAGHTEPYRGHDGMRRYLRDVGRVWEEVLPEPGRVVVRGDAVAVTGRIYAWGEGRVVDQAAGWTFELRDGQVSRVRVHGTARDALASAPA